MNDKRTLYHVLSAHNYYDSGPEVEKETFKSLDDVYTYMAYTGFGPHEVIVVQGEIVKLDDQRLRKMLEEKRAAKAAAQQAEREAEDRALYERLRERFQETP